MEPIKIEEIENIDISDEFCKNELVGYFNALIIKHGRLLKKQGYVRILNNEFMVFPDKDIIENVVDLFCLNGFAIFFYSKDTHQIVLDDDTVLHISTDPDDLYDEVYDMNFQTMTGTFKRIKNIHKSDYDKHMKGREWIEGIAVNEFNHEGDHYKVVNLSTTGFDIIKLEDKKSKKKSIFTFFN